MQSLQDLLQGRHTDEPPEIKLIKQYVQDEFQQIVEVMVRDKDIVISVSGSSFANTLRLKSPTIKELCQTDKRLIFRIT